eukprot:11006505-Karenia_brevis.AAC.1
MLQLHVQDCRMHSHIHIPKKVLHLEVKGFIATNTCAEEHLLLGRERSHETTVIEHVLEAIRTT